VRACCAADCVDSGFAAVLQQAEPLPLGEGLWWLHSERQVRQPGLAFITPQQPMRYRDQPLNGLFCLASLGRRTGLLERLCEVLIEGRGQMLYQATSSRAVLEVLGGEAPADWPSARVVLANPMVCMPARPRCWRNWPKALTGKSVCASSTARSRRVGEEPEQAAQPRRPAWSGAGADRRAEHRRRCLAGAAGRYRRRPR
jgi:hypothetical protein